MRVRRGRKSLLRFPFFQFVLFIYGPSNFVYAAVYVYSSVLFRLLCFVKIQRKSYILFISFCLSTLKWSFCIIYCTRSWAAGWCDAVVQSASGTWKCHRSVVHVIWTVFFIAQIFKKKSSQLFLVIPDHHLTLLCLCYWGISSLSCSAIRVCCQEIFYLPPSLLLTMIYLSLLPSTKSGWYFGYKHGSPDICGVFPQVCVKIRENNGPFVCLTFLPS